MNPRTRDQIISHLLQLDDINTKTIEELQKQVTELQKKLAEQASTTN